MAYARKRSKFIYSLWNFNVCSNQRTAVEWYDPYEKNYNVPCFSIFNKNFSFKQNRKKWENPSGRKIVHIKSAAEKFHAIFSKKDCWKITRKENKIYPIKKYKQKQSGRHFPSQTKAQALKNSYDARNFFGYQMFAI